MTSCLHTMLELLPAAKSRLRCRRCHLTLDRDELTDRYCPECFDHDGARCYEFEELPEPENGAARYRCEDCGIVITSG